MLDIYIYILYIYFNLLGFSFKVCQAIDDTKKKSCGNFFFRNKQLNSILPQSSFKINKRLRCSIWFFQCWCRSNKLISSRATCVCAPHGPTELLGFSCPHPRQNTWMFQEVFRVFLSPLGGPQVLRHHCHHPRNPETEWTHARCKEQFTFKRRTLAQARAT